MERELVGLQDAVRGWQVSERALRRKLGGGDAPEAQRAEDGSWLLPVAWLDTEFERHTIDLRDPEISEGLAGILFELTSMGEKVTRAEVRAAVAENERDHLAVRLRETTDELEQERTEHQRLQQDFVQLERDLAVRTDRLERLEAEAEHTWNAWQEAEAVADRDREQTQVVVDRLSAQLDRQQQKVRLLEAVTTRWQRRRFQRLLEELDHEPA